MRKALIKVLAVTTLDTVSFSGAALAATHSTAIRRGFSCAGTNSNDIINGSRTFDFKYGGGGDDVLYGNSGDDEIPKPKRR